METYNGQVRTPQDAIILFEACRLGLLPRVQRRLSEKERQSIRSGSVFVWDEREAGMRRWTDGKSWSASRVSGSFLTYREMEGKRGGNSFPPHAPSGKTLESGRNSADDQNQQGEAEEGPDGYRYKPDGLMKQSFSITTSQGQHLHLISYFARAHATNTGLQQPSCDPTLRSIRPQKGMYPESSVNDQSTVPAVTRSPMMGAPGYTMAPQTPAYHQSSQPPPGYIPAGYAQHGGFQYPPSPMNAPQYHYPMHHYPQGPSGLPLPGYPPGPYAPPQMSQPPPQHYDQRPIRTPENGLPPPSQQQQHQHQHHQHQQQHQHQHQQQQGLAPPQMSQPPISQHNGASAYLQAPTLQYEQPPPPPGRQSPSEQAAAALQIDPRLIGASAPSANPGSVQIADLKEDSQNEARENPRSTSASQAPTITSLVNGSAATPTAEKTDSAESTGEETGGTSPGGTKQTTSIQDIPSEKLGFREDKRALRQLDKVFAV